MKTGEEVVRKYDLSRLRFWPASACRSTPKRWYGATASTVGRTFHDNWRQTETGGIMIANFAAMDIKPGSMGRELPGIDAPIVSRPTDGTVCPKEEPMTG
jgi:acetyl-CoA synthetase